MRRRNLAAIWLTAGTLLMAGCGSHVDHARIVAVGNGYSAPNSAAGPAAPVATADVGAPTGTAVSAPVPAAAGSTPAVVSTVAAPTTTTGDAKAATKGTAPRTGAGVAVAGSAAKPCPAGLSPIVIGQTLATSGLIGSTIGNLRPGLAIWAKNVNAHGGVQCHPVQVISLDDGSDSARVASNFATLRDRGAVAILAAGEPITSGALRVAAERDHVPVIGGDVVTLDWYESPYFFPQGMHPLVAYDGSTVEAAKARPGAKGAAIVYCVEASICTGIKNNFPNSAKRAGLQVVATKAVSLTQSDFTAECQAFKDAKADVVWLALDGSANTRFARSCGQLGYFPQLATSAIGIPPAAAADPNLQKATVYLGGQNVPFATDDTPGAREFHAALAQFAPGFAPDQNTLAGFASGKVFEAALAKVADKARAGAVTTPMVLDGLWQLKDIKLDGLVGGLTYTKGEPTKSVPCYYTLLLNTKGVTAPFGSKLNCFKD